jgi:hypothetical protein
MENLCVGQLHSVSLMAHFQFLCVMDLPTVVARAVLPSSQSAAGVYASVSPEPSSSMMGTMRLSLDMRLYLVTKAVNRRHRYVSFWNRDLKLCRLQILKKKFKWILTNYTTVTIRRWWLCQLARIQSWSMWYVRITGMHLVLVISITARQEKCVCVHRYPHFLTGKKEICHHLTMLNDLRKLICVLHVHFCFQLLSMLNMYWGSTK